MHIQHINPIRLQLPQTIPYTHMQTALMVSGKVDRRMVLAQRVPAIPRGEFGRNHHLVAVFALGHPLADPRLALLVLVIVGRVDEVAAVFDEGVEEGEGLRFVHAAHAVLPGFADGHGAQAEGGDADAGCAGEDAHTT